MATRLIVTDGFARVLDREEDWFETPGKGVAQMLTQILVAIKCAAKGKAKGGKGYTGAAPKTGSHAGPKKAIGYNPASGKQKPAPDKINVDGVLGYRPIYHDGEEDPDCAVTYTCSYGKGFDEVGILTIQAGRGTWELS